MGTVLLWFGATAVALFIGYATVPPNAPFWITTVLWWGFIVSGVSFFLIGLAYLARIVRRHLINRQVPDKKGFESQEKLNQGTVTLFAVKNKSKVKVDDFSGKSTVPLQVVDASEEADVDMKGVKIDIDTTDKRERRESELESEQHDLAMGEHRTRIVELLNTWKEQLSLMIKSDELDEIVAIIENDDEFCAIIEHCPSVKEKYKNLGIQRVQYKMHLNPKAIVKGKVIKHKATKQEITKNKKLLDEKMQSVIKAIGACLKSNEYTKKENRCDWCPEDMR